MEMSASLFKKATFDRADDGRLDIPRDLRAGLERRRLEAAPRRVVYEMTTSRSISI